MNTPIKLSPSFININILELMNTSIASIKNEINFCYPNNNLDENRVHPSLSSIGEICTNMKNIIIELEVNALVEEGVKLYPDKNVEELKVLCKDIKPPTVLKYFEKIVFQLLKEKKFCYPNGTFDDSRGHSALQIITGIVKSYEFSSQTLLTLIAEDTNNILFNMHLNKLFNSINIENCYNYAYPNTQLDQNRVHTSLQMLTKHSVFFKNLLNTLSVSSDAPVIIQEQFNRIVNNYKEDAQNLHNILKKAYPGGHLDYNVAHTTLTKFIHHYRALKKQYLNDVELINIQSKEIAPTHIEQPAGLQKIKKIL